MDILSHNAGFLKRLLIFVCFNGLYLVKSPIVQQTLTNSLFLVKTETTVVQKILSTKQQGVLTIKEKHSL